jgi:hypothetical protein
VGWVDEVIQRCIADPECPGPSEPEQDEDLRYYVCTVCGSESGYVRVRQAASEGACQLGITEPALRQLNEPAPVFLGTIGRRPVA